MGLAYSEAELQERIFRTSAEQLVQGAVIPSTRARAGVRWVRAVTDVPAAISEIRRGRLSIGEYVRSLRPPLERAIFALDDPFPAFADVPWLLYRPLAARLGRDNFCETVWSGRCRETRIGAMPIADAY